MVPRSPTRKPADTTPIEYKSPKEYASAIPETKSTTITRIIAAQNIGGTFKALKRARALEPTANNCA